MEMVNKHWLKTQKESELYQLLQNIIDGIIESMLVHIKDLLSHMNTI